MFIWINRWFDKKAKQSLENAQREQKLSALEGLTSVNLSVGSLAGIGAIKQNAQITKAVISSRVSTRFTVHYAEGGVIIETYSENPALGGYPTLYVIQDDKDIGSEIGKIITMETLKS